MTRTIGEAIEGRLHEMKIKPEELATVLDVPLPTLSGWLWLENDIPAQYILKIAHVLRCTPTYLLSGGEDDRETPTKSDAIEDLIRATVAEVLRQQEAQRVTAASDASQAQGTGSRCEFFRRCRALAPRLRFPAEKSEELFRLARELTK